MKYDPNGGTLHDLAAVGTRWAICHPSQVIGEWDVFETVFRDAVKEFRKPYLDIYDLATGLLTIGLDHFTRPNIQKALDEIEHWFA
jgi:hypothetical protein